MEVLDVPTTGGCLGKGTYRVQVPAQSGYKAGLSKAVTLKR